MDGGNVEPAEVLGEGIEEQADVRRATSIEVDADILVAVERRLDAQRDAAGAFFDLALTDREGASFLRYGDGGFYKPHSDCGVIEAWPGAARRQIALVVFLNSSRDRAADGDFTGGALRLFLDDDPIEVRPAEGLLVAFPADTLHEVAVVHGGTRDTIVDWFY